MPREAVTIATRDGNCPAAIFTPTQGSGPWPGIIFFMDGLGIRPVLWEMGQRLADGGYVVALPDLYYRQGSYAPMVPAEILADPAKREILMKMVGSLNRDRKVADTAAFLDFLANRADVKGGKVGTTGYCMGGHCSITAIGAYPDRIAAAAAFHGGNLATEDPDSPHRFLKGVTGRIYVAAAVEDPHFPAEQMTRLEQALTEAGVDHRAEFYAGARHGFAVRDLPVYDPEAAERHWTATFALFGEALSG